jgi:hypothetical protein
MGVVFVLGLFVLLITRIMIIGVMAHRARPGVCRVPRLWRWLMAGLAGRGEHCVNLGVLPTKG